MTRMQSVLMKRTRRVLAAVLGLASLAPAIGASQPREALSPFTVEHLLQLNAVSSAAFSPAGDLLVLVEAPAANEVSDHGLYLIDGRLGKLLAVTQSAATARPLFAQEPDALYALQPFSPDGRFLSFHVIKGGRAKLGVFDRRSGETRLFAEAPAYDMVHDYDARWVSDTEFVYAALPEGSQPWGYLSRRSTGERLHEAWQRTWRGQEPSLAVNFSRKDGGGDTPLEGRLILANALTGETRTVAEGSFSDLRVSPSGRYLAAARQFVRVQPRTDGERPYWDRGRSVLYVFDLNVGEHRILEDRDASYGTAEWSPAGDEFAIFMWPFDKTVGEGRFHRYEVRTGRLTVLEHSGLDLASVREEGPPPRPFRPAWVGDSIAVVARPNADGDMASRFTPKGVLGYYDARNLGRRDWFLLRPGLPPRNLTERFEDVSPWLVGSDERGASLLLDSELWRVDTRARLKRAAEGYGKRHAGSLAPLDESDSRQPLSKVAALSHRMGDVSEVLFVDASGREKPRTVRLTKGAEVLAVSSRSEAVLSRVVSGTGTVLLLQSGRSEPVEVHSINGFIKAVAKPTRQKIMYDRGDGIQAISCAILPHNYQHDRRYPVIVYAYPGYPGGQACSGEEDLQRNRTYDNKALLAGAGYVVYIVTNSVQIISSEQGQMARMPEAVDRAIVALIAQGYADPDRIGHYGASGAGLSGLWMAAHKNRFKAVVAVNGLSNLLGHYFGNGLDTAFYSDFLPFRGSFGRYESPRIEQFSIGATPWEDVLSYWRASPISRVKEIDVPILLVNSDMDQNFSQQFDDMFTALTRWRKEAQYVRYWGEGHGPTSPANVRDMWRRTLEWFDKYLGEGA